MRIVGGKWKGRAIEAPKGREVTRPTTDRGREQMASMILSARGLDIEGDSVLDAFAGSGAMGFELLSRGAAHATLVDVDRPSAARLKRTAAALGAGPREVSATCGDVFALAAAGRLPGAPFDIVFLDPPYAFEAARVSRLVEDLLANNMLAEGCVVLYEHSSKAPGLDCAALLHKKNKSHGVTAVDVYVYERD